VRNLSSATFIRLARADLLYQRKAARGGGLRNTEPCGCKTEGVVFYTDIINTLRDEFIDNNLQTPFFVSQHTGREQFVDDAKRLDVCVPKTLSVLI
jgi:hypothetical protein